jgi:hypothetical protein
MDGDYGLSDLRFDGYSNEELAGQVDGLRGGAGSETLHNAVRALVSLSEVGPSRVPDSGALLRVVEKLAPWESTPLAESLTGLVASSA